MICHNKKCEEYDNELGNCSFGSGYPEHCKIRDIVPQNQEEIYPDTPEEFIEKHRINKSALNSAIPCDETIRVSDVQDMLRYYFHR